jgi:hypothetical protein
MALPPTTSHPAAPALASLLQRERGRVLRRWSERAAQQTDDTERLLERVVEALEIALREGQSGPALLEAARVHGLLRRAQGVSLDGLARDYGLLRDTFLDQVEQSSEPITLAEVRVLTDLIDRALAESAAAHARTVPP